MLKNLKYKRDEYNLASCQSSEEEEEESDQEGLTENENDSVNNSASSTFSTDSTSSCHRDLLAYPVGEGSTLLGRDELIALEFLCGNKSESGTSCKEEIGGIRKKKSISSVKNCFYQPAKRIKAT